VRSRTISAFFCLVCLVSVPAVAGTVDEAGRHGSGEGEPADQAGVAKPLCRIEIKEGLLSVKLVDAGFGEVMNEIAEKSGIKVEITGGAYSRTVTTSFNGLDLERGISRLLSLLQEKNYMIRYDSKGRVSKVEVYSSGATPARQPAVLRPQAAPSAIAPVAAPLQNMPRIRKNPPLSKRILRPAGEKESDQPKTGIGDEDTDDKGYEEEMPLAPSGDVPPYIPPRNPQD
jgi:hypothetical protein